MSVYNGAGYVRAAVESILSQTLDDFEMIVIDDGSSDSSVEIVRSFADPRISIISNTSNMGLPASLNKGIRAAKAQLIARQDADDLSHPHRLQDQVRVFEADPDVAMVGTDWVSIDKDGDAFRLGHIPNEPETIKELLVSQNVKYPHGSLMFRKTALLDIGCYDPQFYYTQDLDLQLRLIKQGLKFRGVEDSLYYYRVSVPNSRFKTRCQGRFRELAFARFRSDEEIAIPDVLQEEREIGSDRTNSMSPETDYWYQVGLFALSEGRYRQGLKCARRLLARGRIDMVVKMAGRGLLNSRSVRQGGS